MTRTAGSSSCNNSSRFGATSTLDWVTPVMFPPGRARLRDEAELDRIAADFKNDRNGRGGRFAATAAGVLVAAITATCLSPDLPASPTIGHFARQPTDIRSPHCGQ